MNFSTQIKRGVSALVLFSAIGAIALSHAETTASKVAVVANITAAHGDVASTPTMRSPSPQAITRVHVGRPLTVGANPTAREIARALR